MIPYLKLRQRLAHVGESREVWPESNLGFMVRRPFLGITVYCIIYSNDQLVYVYSLFNK